MIKFLNSSINQIRVQNAKRICRNIFNGIEKFFLNTDLAKSFYKLNKT